MGTIVLVQHEAHGAGGKENLANNIGQNLADQIDKT